VDQLNLNSRAFQGAQVASDLLKKKRFYDYSIYGISLRSQFLIANANTPPKSQTPQIVVTKGITPLATGEFDSEAWFIQKILPDGSVYLRWSRLFEFLIAANGHRISGRALEDSSPEVFSTYLLGQVLSFALVKQGLESLHASATVVDGGSVGFLGDCGHGKSTLLASFLNTGHKQLTDDLLLDRRNRGLLMSYPGPRRIKLLPESVFLMNGKSDGVAMNPLVAKMIIPVSPTNFQRTPVPLKALYVLATSTGSERIKITDISNAKALLALIKNSFNAALNDSARLERQFQWATEIVSSIPVRRISYPRSFEALPAVRDAILTDLSL
jgi:hypothetical protein